MIAAEFVEKADRVLAAQLIVITQARKHCICIDIPRVQEVHNSVRTGQGDRTSPSELIRGLRHSDITNTRTGSAQNALIRVVIASYAGNRAPERAAHSWNTKARAHSKSESRLWQLRELVHKLEYPPIELKTLGKC